MSYFLINLYIACKVVKCVIFKFLCLKLLNFKITRRMHWKAQLECIADKSGIDWIRCNGGLGKWIRGVVGQREHKCDPSTFSEINYSMPTSVHINLWFPLQIFKELLVQAKITYNLSPALRRRRRQSLPPQQCGSSGPGTPPPQGTPPSVASHVPSAAQLQHLQQIQERTLGGKRNSCIIS